MSVDVVFSFREGGGSALVRSLRVGVANQIASRVRRRWEGGIGVFATRVAICSLEGVSGKSTIWKETSLKDQMRWLRRVVRSSGSNPYARKDFAIRSGVVVISAGIGGVMVIWCAGVLLQMAERCMWSR